MMTNAMTTANARLMIVTTASTAPRSVPMGTSMSRINSQPSGTSLRAPQAIIANADTRSSGSPMPLAASPVPNFAKPVVIGMDGGPTGKLGKTRRPPWSLYDFLRRAPFACWCLITGDGVPVWAILFWPAIAAVDLILTVGILLSLLGWGLCWSLPPDWGDRHDGHTTRGTTVCQRARLPRLRVCQN